MRKSDNFDIPPHGLEFDHEGRCTWRVWPDGRREMIELWVSEEQMAALRENYAVDR